MELKAYRIERLKAAAAAAGADMIVATLPANLNYITTGYVCINQDVLTRAECAIGYIPSKDKYVYIVGYADLPTVLEFAGNDAEVYFAGGGFFFEKGAENDEFVDKIMAYKEKAYPTTADAWNAAVRSNLPEGSTIAIDESRIFASQLKYDQVATVVKIFSVHEIVFGGLPAGGLHGTDGASFLRGHQVQPHAGLRYAAAAQLVQGRIEFVGSGRVVRLLEKRHVVVDGHVCAAGVGGNVA